MHQGLVSAIRKAMPSILSNDPSFAAIIAKVSSSAVKVSTPYTNSVGPSGFRMNVFVETKDATLEATTYIAPMDRELHKITVTYWRAGDTFLREPQEIVTYAALLHGKWKVLPKTDRRIKSKVQLHEIFDVLAE